MVLGTTVRFWWGEDYESKCLKVLIGLFSFFSKTPDKIQLEVKTSNPHHHPATHTQKKKEKML